MSVSRNSYCSMDKSRSTLNKLRTLKPKWKKNDETSQNCNTEFNFVNFDNCTMTRSIELELQNRSKDSLTEKHIFGEAEQTLRGSLWQMSDSILSRWREHFCVLTKSSIHSFRNGFGSRKVSKIQLTDICDVKMIREKGQLILCIEINKMKRIMFRAEEGIRVWYNSILTNIAILKKSNHRRFFSAEYHQNRPRMGINSLTYAI